MGTSAAKYCLSQTGRLIDQRDSPNVECGSKSNRRVHRFIVFSYGDPVPTAHQVVQSFR